MKAATLIVLAFLAVPVMAQAQTETPRAQKQSQLPSNLNDDLPIGSPYRTGDVAVSQSQVPLRDYLSTRIDQLRSEMIDRFENSQRQQEKILDERDRQYAQRFAAQQEAVAAALQAAKEAVANALSAAKEAVSKAEDASNKRFEGVNEFRNTLSDQAEKFITRDTANARFDGMDVRFKILEEKTNINSARLDTIKALGEGANNLWGYLIGVIGVIMLLGNFVMNYNRTQGVKR